MEFIKVNYTRRNGDFISFGEYIKKTLDDSSASRI